MSLGSRIADWIIARSQRRPYRKGHLHHADGSLYMGRYTLFETRWLTARVHYLATPDWGRHLHDHPWSFVSIVLRGSYIEYRPVDVEPCFPGRDDLGESCNGVFREIGSVAFRRATDRHSIGHVEPDTWSLFIYGPKRQWWGFYTPAGKVHWQAYPSVHSTTPGLLIGAGAGADNVARD